MRTGEGVVVLIPTANWRGQAFGEVFGSLDSPADNHACTVQNDGKLGVGQKFRRLGNRINAARGALEFHNRGQIDIDHLRPHIARNVDLCRGRQAFGLHDHTVQNLGNAGGVADLLLISDAIGEHAHLFNLLKTAQTDGLVGGLRRDQQHRRVVPVCRLDRCYKIRNPRSVLRNRHGHFA